ncbi:chondroitinase family polysaccharide lyase [Micromonospora sp. NPDC047074]|uniref:chondroitinase family polysaccharide lyase n=1 Tax=Micromonospora sp. NPDC047074 TaxID=3154339 RepID=UPI0033D2782C
MPEHSSGLSRRHVLSTVAAGVAIVGLPSVARAAGPTAEPTRTVGVDPSTLESRALALEPPVFLFETHVPEQVRARAGSRLSISADVARTGQHSLRWDYQPAGVVEMRAPLRYAPSAYQRGGDQGFMGTVDTFSLWLYNDQPVDDVLRIEFGRGSGVDAWCEIHLGFQGWRTAWIRYQYDLSGRPHQGMNTVRLVAPRRVPAGTLYLDQLILNNELRPDHPTPDRQVPFVNAESAQADNDHWLGLLRFSRLLAAAPPAPEPTADELASLARVRAAYYAAVRKAGAVTDASVATLATSVEALGVPARGERGRGRPIIGYQAAVYPAPIAAELTTFVDGVELRKYTDLMYQLATAYDAATGAGHRATLAALYLRMFAHLRDQGWTDGSAQGTIHHVGYQARGFYNSVYLVRDMLAGSGLLDAARADLAWLTGFGRLRDDWTDGHLYGGVFDIVNTTIQGLLGTALLAPTPAEQVANLKLLKDWLDHALTPSPGIEDGFKVDGTVFHHVGFYPDYARDGMSGGSPTLVMLGGTAFAVSKAAHERWKQALLRMRVYANKTQWPLSIAMRHPTGLTGLNIAPFQTMTEAGSPDGSSALDPEIGAAFLRLLPEKPSSAQQALARKLAAAGVTAEADPAGNWAMNYAALAVQRRDNWLVAVRGHNRYLWSTEIYEADNLYGRYVTYGQIQVMSGGNPVDNRGSGFAQPGWDWNRWPGTTTINLPFSELRADMTGTIEEMLLSDSRFAGAGSIGDRNGVFGMDLHEHPKYDESHRARKSVFLFDDRLVAIGTAITNTDGLHPTETTLFQTLLPQTTTPQYDGELGEIRALPYREVRDLDRPVWMVDPQGIGYYLPAGQRLALTRATQTGPDEGDTGQGSADFATAWLDHGTAPDAKSYEYAMVIRADQDTMADFALRMADPGRAPYRVLRADEQAHVVWDRETGITGYVVFEPQDRLAEGRLAAVDTPSLLLTYHDDADLVVSVTDPDLRLYSGLDPDQYDSSGQFVGRVTSYSRPWRRSPSLPRPLRLTLHGRWQLTEEHPRVTVESVSATTVLRVLCQHGEGVRFRLRPA